MIRFAIKEGQVTDCDYLNLDRGGELRLHR